MIRGSPLFLFTLYLYPLRTSPRIELYECHTHSSVVYSCTLIGRDVLVYTQALVRSVVHTCLRPALLSLRDKGIPRGLRVEDVLRRSLHEGDLSRPDRRREPVSTRHIRLTQITSGLIYRRKKA